MIDYSKLEPGFYYATERTQREIDKLMESGSFQFEFYARISGCAPFLKVELFNRFNWTVEYWNGKTLLFIEV